MSWFAMDATGTAIRSTEPNRYGHVFVLVAPGDGVMFRYTPQHDGPTVEELFGGYLGTLVADASANHNGLFSFYAGWTRPGVFGKVACMSGSFWWDNRFMVRQAQILCPAPRPVLYIDSGAALNRFERDPGMRDGFDHTRALRDALVSHCYVSGASLHLLTFPGLVHDGPSWAGRLALPLQLLFPRRALEQGAG